MPTEPLDIVVEARTKLAKPNYGMGKRNRELMTKLCDEIERLRKQIKQMAQDARDDAEGAANEARWQERQGEDYGSY